MPGGSRSFPDLVLGSKLWYCRAIQEVLVTLSTRTRDMFSDLATVAVVIAFIWMLLL